MTADWFRDAVIYEIYPQSYLDTNADGIGDLRGVIDKLDYIASLGVDAIWFNPCFDSPFFDAGYDVADYLRVAPRYGSNADLAELIAAARERGIRILLDLVVGHTSIEHPWFQAELAADGPGPDGDRYVWSAQDPGAGWGIDLPGIPGWVKSPGPRPGWYLKNFYDEQPALNFGWLRTDPAQPWRDAIDAPGPMRNRAALQEILDFWLGMGVAGFRVDMAFSLIKDEILSDSHAASAAIWHDLRAWLETAYPEAVLIPEGEEPRGSAGFAFDADFALVISAAHASLFDDHSAGILPWHLPREPFFAAAGFMVARCAGKDRYFAVLDAMFHEFDTWAKSGDVRASLLTAGKAGGLSEQQVMACVADDGALDTLQTRVAANVKQGDITGTPTFSFNGVTHVGPMTAAELDAAVAKASKK